MAVTQYSLAEDGNNSIGDHFLVRDFRCLDGSDLILIDDVLVRVLDLVWYQFGPVNITSAYRNASHNSAVGGASNSQHLLGKAADFYVSGVPPIEIARWLQEIQLPGFPNIGAPGIILYATFVHVDVRDGTYYRGGNIDGFDDGNGLFPVGDFTPYIYPWQRVKRKRKWHK